MQEKSEKIQQKIVDKEAVAAYNIRGKQRRSVHPPHLQRLSKQVNSDF